MLDLLFLLVFFRRKADTLTLFYIFLSAILSFYYFEKTIPVIVEEGEAQFQLTWSDTVKIDGGTIKGFAKTTTGSTVYASYRFESAEEKQWFKQLDFPELQFTVSGSFQPLPVASHPYAFHMANYLKMYGASGVFQVDKIWTVNEKKTFYSRLLAQRKRVKTHIEETFPRSLIPEAEALLIGDRSGMDDETATNYRRLGITHLFAISGLHVGLLTFIVRESLLRIKVRRENVDIFLMLFLPFYAVIAGGAPSVWRAVLVTVFILMTIYSRIPIRLDHVLAISAIGLIMLKPNIVFQPGFQLSYLAALSLILSAKILQRTTSKLKLSFLVTTITQLALYPVILFHFYELSLSSFIVNLVYVPLYSVVILPMNIVLLLITAIAMPLAKLIFGLYVPFRSFVENVTNLVAELPYQLWMPGKPAVIGIVFAVIGLSYFFIQYEKGKNMLSCLPYVILPALLIHFLPYMDPELRVTYVDVGQGDSIVIELPYKRAVYVIDTGGSVPFGEKNWQTPEKIFEVGRQIVVPYLKGRGITKVDKLIISHAHLDHMGGAHEIVEEVTVREIHLPPNSIDVPEMEKLVQVATKQGIPFLTQQDGSQWMEKGAQFYYLGPQKTEYVGNDSSLVLLMKTAGPSFLFTGDIEEDGERAFTQKYGDIEFGALILKVGHHGSKTSSTEPFVKAVQPVLAVISAGRNNRFNHPHEEVLETFQTYEIPVLVTAAHGSITVHVEGEEWTVSAMQ